MNDPNIERLDKTITGLTAMVHDVQYSNLALQRVLKDLMPTMTLQQQEIFRKYAEYKKQMSQAALIKLEKTNPRLAAVLSSILAGEKPI